MMQIFINLFLFIHKIFTTSTRFSHNSRIYYNHKIINRNYFITFLFHMSMKIDTPSFKNKLKLLTGISSFWSTRFYVTFYFARPIHLPVSQILPKTMPLLSPMAKIRTLRLQPLLSLFQKTTPHNSSDRLPAFFFSD